MGNESTWPARCPLRPGSPWASGPSCPGAEPQLAYTGTPCHMFDNRGYVSWRFDPPFDAAQRAALESGRSLIYVCPPAAWAAAPVLQRLPGDDAPGLHTVVIAPETSIGRELARAANEIPARAPIHVATGLARSATLLGSGSVRTLFTTPADGLDLVQRAALKLAAARWIVLAWPELSLSLGHSGALDALLSEATGVPRAVITADEAAIADLLERHARRAPLTVAARSPETPGGGVRYVVAPFETRSSAIAGILDVTNPREAVVWDPMPPERPADKYPPGLRPFQEGATAQLAVAMDLPDAATLAALRTAAPDVVVLVGAYQVPYLARLARPLRPLRIAGAADRARDHLFETRRRLRERLQAGDVGAQLLALEPLFDEYDPALVAAAALTLATPPTAESPASEAPVPAWVRIRLDAGRREQIRAGDIVGVLLNAVGLGREDLGRVDLREGFTLVEVRPSAAERALAGLTGAVVRGRRLIARIDRR